MLSQLSSIESPARTDMAACGVQTEASESQAIRHTTHYGKCLRNTVPVWDAVAQDFVQAENPVDISRSPGTGVQLFGTGSGDEAAGIPLNIGSYQGSRERGLRG